MILSLHLVCAGNTCTNMMAPTIMGPLFSIRRQVELLEFTRSSYNATLWHLFASSCASFEYNLEQN